MSDNLWHEMHTECLARLEAATEGSRELDCQIHVALAELSGNPQKWEWTGKVLRRPNPSNDRKRDGSRMWPEWDQWVPQSAPIRNYTTSLNAALPWENIAHVHAPDWHGAKPPGRWQAAHDCGDGCAVYGYGHTEPLARRIAALKAREK